MDRQITLEYKHFEELQDAYEREKLLIKTILKLTLINTSAKEASEWINTEYPFLKTWVTYGSKKGLNVYDSHTNLITVYADY